MKDIYALTFTRGGLFYLVNNVIDLLEKAEREGFRFVVRLEASLYADEARKEPVWNYYFEDPFELDPSRSWPEYPYVPFRKDHLMAPRLRNGIMQPLLLPRDRPRANRLIRKYVRLKPPVMEKINRFRDAHAGERILGLHLRGPGRLHGGMPEIGRRVELEDGVPFASYYRHIDAYLDEHPDVKVLLCTDSEMVVRKCRARYGEKILTYDAIRSDYGEMHELGPQEDGPSFTPYRLGEDVLVEAYLLADTEYLVHGNSNVSNFIICLNPDLPHRYVFDDVRVNWTLVHARVAVGAVGRRIRRLLGR